MLPALNIDVLHDSDTGSKGSQLDCTQHRICKRIEQSYKSIGLS